MTEDFNDIARTKIASICNYCFRISTETKADAFFEYSPHITSIDVRIYPNGWSKKSEPEYLKYENDITINYEFWGIEALDDILAQLKERYKQYLIEV